MLEGRFFVIDFDSTIIQSETLEELAAISLKNDQNKEEILSQIKGITDSAMEGSISVPDALDMRIKLLHANKEHLKLLIGVLKSRITPSFLRNRDFFKLHRNNIYIISNGFREVMIPVLEQFGLLEKNIFGNTFSFDGFDNITGFDEKNILAKDNGKVEALRSLKLNGDVYVLGDGYTDYQMKESGLAAKFFAITENARRSSVVEKADYVVSDFDEFLSMNSGIKVLLLDNISPEAVSMFKKAGYAVEVNSKHLDEKELANEIKKVSVLGIRTRTGITEGILSNANKLKVIGVFSIGTSNVDLNACSKKGIVVFNAPYSNTRSVVELAIGEIIMLMRNAFDKSMKLHNGVWDKSASGSFEIRGKKLGIIGYGNIGAQLSVLAESLGMEVYYYDIVERLALGNVKKCKSLEELLKISDVVSLHVDGNPKNKNLIGEKEFQIMKEGAVFLNLSRGSLFDSKALAKCIQNGKIKGAGIDTFPNEPKSSNEEFVSELRNLPNVILTPHIGGSTEEAQKNIAEFVSARIIDFVDSGNTSLSVNFPNIQLPVLKDAHRFIHVHDNVPGVLSQINGVLARRNINILGQYLKTNELIGYVITDVSREYDGEVIDELKKVFHTINFRVLY